MERTPARYASAALENAVFVIIALVVLAFVFLLGSLGGSGGNDETAARLGAELEAERQRVRDLEAELQELRSEQTP